MRNPQTAPNESRLGIRVGGEVIEAQNVLRGRVASDETMQIHSEPSVLFGAVLTHVFCAAQGIRRKPPGLFPMASSDESGLLRALLPRKLS